MKSANLEHKPQILVTEILESLEKTVVVEDVPTPIFPQETDPSQYVEPVYEGLVFEKEKNVPDFEREPIYDLNSFGGKQVKAEVILTPPPNFEKSLKTLPKDVLDAFKSVLHGEVIGIWPIKVQDVLK